MSKGCTYGTTLSYIVQDLLLLVVKNKNALQRRVSPFPFSLYGAGVKVMASADGCVLWEELYGIQQSAHSWSIERRHFCVFLCEISYSAEEAPKGDASSPGLWKTHLGRVLVSVSIKNEGGIHPYYSLRAAPAAPAAHPAHHCPEARLDSDRDSKSGQVESTWHDLVFAS